MSQKIYLLSSKRIPQLKTSLTFPLLLPKFMRAAFTIYLHWPGVKQLASVPNSMQHKEYNTSRYDCRRRWIHHKQTNHVVKGKKERSFSKNPEGLETCKSKGGDAWKYMGIQDTLRYTSSSMKRSFSSFVFKVLTLSFPHQPINLLDFNCELQKCTNAENVVCQPLLLFLIKPKIET